MNPEICSGVTSGGIGLGMAQSADCCGLNGGSCCLGGKVYWPSSRTIFRTSRVLFVVEQCVRLELSAGSNARIK